MTTTTNPSASYALERLGAAGDLVGPAARAAYLALAALSDADLSSPNGLSAVPAWRVGRIVGRATATAERILRALAVADVGVVMVVERAALVERLSGVDAARNLPRGARVRGYRLSEEAYA